jgi:hypothetical protein
MPNTTCVRPSLSWQRVHVEASVATSSSGVGTSDEVSDGPTVGIAGRARPR